MTKTNRFTALNRPPNTNPDERGTPRSSVFAPDDLIPVPADTGSLESDIDLGIYASGASIFGTYAQQMYRLGWMPFPQTRTDGRKPPVMDGRMLSWREFQKTRAPLKTLKHWMIGARTCNVAVILGEASQGVFAVDIDITDEDLAQQAVDVVVEMLGVPMARRGNYPKVALLYRVEDLADLPHYGSFRLATDSGDASEHQIEILAAGHMITMVGLHHKTDLEFKCAPASPVMWTPKDLTAVTKSQLEALWDRLEAEFKLYKPRRNGEIDVDIEEGSIDGINVPRLSAFKASQWVENNAGLVIDGRERFLWKLVRETVRRNDPADGTPIGDLRAAIRESFRKKEDPARRWADSRLADEIGEKLQRALRDLKDGRLKPVFTHTVMTPEGPVKKVAKAYRRPVERQHQHSAFEFVGNSRCSLPTRTDPINEEAAKKRRLRLDRKTVGAEAAAALEVGINAFLRDVADRVNRVHVLAGATGVGKSTMALKLSAAHPALFQSMVSPDGTKAGPMVFVVPQYRNVDELRSKAQMLGLDGTADDAELIAAAAEHGLVSEGDKDSYLEQLRRFAVGSGLETMVYAGKVKAGCLRPEEMKALSNANVPSNGLCSKRMPVKNSQGYVVDHEEAFCPFYASCPAIAQRVRIKTVQIVFLVRSFLTLSIPEELQNARALIVDEKFFDLMVHVKTMPLTSLEIGRREPKLTKKERELGVSPFDLLTHRSQAVKIAVEAMKAGLDLGETFLRWSEERHTTAGKATFTGSMLVSDARRVCSSAMTAQSDVSPDMSATEIIEMCARPAGTDVAVEYRFWKVLEDRLAEMASDNMAGRDSCDDRRIRLLDAQSASPTVQVAWKSEANWQSVPTLLLDASTDGILTKLVLGDRPIERHEVEVNLNMLMLAAVDRRLSMSSLFPSKDAPLEVVAKAAELLFQIRCIISTICYTHAHARVFVALPMRLRRAVLKCWRPPFNADFGHHAAVAGIDAYRRHGACLAISRLEIAVQDVDGIVAALTYGTAHAEPAIDPLGTGMDADGNVLYPNKVERGYAMRDGSTERIDVQEHLGDVARRVQAQAREEELRQIGGRLRTVYRSDTVPFFVVTESIPEDMIVDEICAFRDLSVRAGGVFWDAVRLTGGVVEANVLALMAPQYGTVDTYRGWIKQFIEDVPSVRTRYTEIDIVRAGGDVFPAFVAGLQKAGRGMLVPFLTAMGWKGNLIIKKRCDCVLEPAEAPTADAIALAMVDQSSAEVARIDELYSTLADKGEWQQGHRPKDLYRAGSRDGIYSEVQMSFGAWVALSNLRDPWVMMGDRLPAETMTDLDLQAEIEAIGF